MSTTCFGLPVQRHDLRRVSIQLSPFSLIATVTVNLHAYSNPQETDAFISGLLGTNPFAKTENDRCKRSATHQHCNVVFNAAILKSISAKQHCTESPQILDDTHFPVHHYPYLFCIVFGWALLTQSDVTSFFLILPGQLRPVSTQGCRIQHFAKLSAMSLQTKTKTNTRTNIHKTQMGMDGRCHTLN